MVPYGGFEAEFLGELEVVMPIGQAMICDLVPERQRGTAFGVLASVSSVLHLGGARKALDPTISTFFGRFQAAFEAVLLRDEGPGMRSNLASFATTAVARQSFGGLRGWRVVFVLVAIMSLLCALLVRAKVPAELSAPRPSKRRGWLQEQAREGFWRRT